MAIAKSRVQKAKRIFRGEADSELLIRVLNDELGPTVRGNRNIVDRRQLLLLVRRLQALQGRILTGPSWRDDERGLLRFYGGVNRCLERYEAIPLIEPHQYTDPRSESSGWSLTWRRTGTRIAPFLELRMAMVAVNLAQSGQIASLRQCSVCNRWLFRRFEHQKFCGAKCKSEFRRADPQEKQRRREWARNNYWLHKNKNVR